MILTRAAIGAFERLPLPDDASRRAIARLVARTGQSLSAADAEREQRFARDMTAFPIAQHTDLANQQHYALPPAFFTMMLGLRLKYSCCYYDYPDTNLDQAEASALFRTAENAGLANGQQILELGCGWGSLSLWMAQQYPASRIVSVSNSVPQRLHIQAEARRRGLSNLVVLTADMNTFAIGGRFDRIVSVEMFEHMANWRALLEKARDWLLPDGRLFLHVFSHRDAPYRFDASDSSDWIAQHFFSGGIMPSHRLITQFSDLFSVEADWRWSGTHYARTARDWLARLDSDPARVRSLLRGVYASDARLWHRRWRLFLLATEGLFGHANGDVWGISQYRLKLG